MSIISILYCDFSCQYHFLTIWLCISCAPTKFGPNYHSDTQSLHPKSKFMNCQVTAIFFNFPPKSWQRTWKVQSWNCHVELSLSFRPNFGQLLLDIIWIFNYIVYFFLFTKMLFWHKLFLILMIYALLLRNFLSQFTHFFRQFLRAEKPLTPTYSLFGCMIIVGSGHLLFLGKPNIWAFKDICNLLVGRELHSQGGLQSSPTENSLYPSSYKWVS